MSRKYTMTWFGVLTSVGEGQEHRRYEVLSRMAPSERTKSLTVVDELFASPGTASLAKTTNKDAGWLENVRYQTGPGTLMIAGSLKVLDSRPI